MARLIAPNGGTVEVADERVENLLRRGFTEEPKKKAPAKKASSSKSSK
jgi:hypothetical protein